MTLPVLGDLDAERYLLGACLYNVDTLDSVRPELTTSDLHLSAHRHVWAALAALRDRGEKPDHFGVRDELIRRGQGDAVLVDLMDPPSTSGWRTPTRIIQRYATVRRVLRASEDLAELASDQTLDGDEMLDQAKSLLAGVDSIARRNADVPGLDTVGGLIDRVAEQDEEPWLIPGMLRRGWRAIVVAPEGLGKSMIARAITIGAAQGIAPFGGPGLPPVRTLIVDAENPEDVVRATCRPIRHVALQRAGGDFDDYRSWIWHRPGGLNLRTRHDRLEFDQVLEAVRPDIVCAGPLYKLFHRISKETDEGAAGELQQVLDEVRTRYRFALVLEHHAPQADGGRRDVRPFGSSLWLRWPELGIKLIPSPKVKGSLDVGRWRGDRLECNWPDRLDRGERGAWPWVGRWENGMPGSEGEF